MEESLQEVHRPGLPVCVTTNWERGSHRRGGNGGGEERKEAEEMYSTMETIFLKNEKKKKRPEPSLSTWLHSDLG